MPLGMVTGYWKSRLVYIYYRSQKGRTLSVDTTDLLNTDVNEKTQRGPSAISMN